MLRSAQPSQFSKHSIQNIDIPDLAVLINLLKPAETARRQKLH